MVVHTHCVVCVEEIDGIERLHALGPCNHVGVCRWVGDENGIRFRRQL